MSSESGAAPTSHPWSKDALLSKAQRYAEQMAAYSRDDWRYSLWSFLTLELVARAALANVSQTLLADRSDWNNTYHALGFKPTVSKFSPKSIGAKQAFDRLAAILPEFTPEMVGFCTKHLEGRNQELHSGALPFDEQGTSSWLPGYYLACQTLLDSMGESLTYLFGTSEAETMIEALRDDAAKAVRRTISAHKTIWEQKPKNERGVMENQAVTWASRHSGHRVTCRAFTSVAIVTGSPVQPPIRTMEGDLIVERQDLLPARFECVVCDLKISGFSQLNASHISNDV